MENEIPFGKKLTVCAVTGFIAVQIVDDHGALVPVYQHMPHVDQQGPGSPPPTGKPLSASTTSAFISQVTLADVRRMYQIKKP